VLTEDGYNSKSGVDQGYPDDYWQLNASNFANPPASDGDTLSFVFGGLGSDSGTLWTYSAVWDDNDAYTDHGTVSTTQSGTCPTMNDGAWDGSQKVFQWTAPAGTYHIYRSTLASGANNGASNGRYQYVDTVVTTEATGTYTDSVTVESWHIVIPAESGTGAVNGCHSEESGPSPTAVTLSGFGAASDWATWLGRLGAALLIALAFVLILYRQYVRKEL
jgi:hypothetical protein